MFFFIKFSNNRITLRYNLQNFEHDKRIFETNCEIQSFRSTDLGVSILKLFYYAIHVDPAVVHLACISIMTLQPHPQQRFFKTINLFFLIMF